MPVILVVCVPDIPPVKDDELICGVAHVYMVFEGTVPSVPFKGVTVNGPLQITLLI